MYKKRKETIKQPYANYKIRAKTVRLIDEKGNQLGVLTIEDAIQKAIEADLDLIQVTEKIDPPVCKIMDYGKYIYQLKKKDKSTKQNKGGELKGIRLKFAISDHDLEIRAKQAEKFLKHGDKIRIEMKLRGRERSLGQTAKEKIKKFLDILNDLIPIKMEGDLKKQPRGLTMIVSKK